MQTLQDNPWQSPYFRGKDGKDLIKTLVSSEVTSVAMQRQVTVAKHMEMSAEDIAAALAYGCRRLVEEEMVKSSREFLVIQLLGCNPEGNSSRSS